MSEQITDQMIDDILCAAFEGGSNYWCEEVRVLGDWPTGADYASECISRGGRLALAEDQEERGPQRYEWHPLDRQRIERGIRRAASLRRGGVERFYDEHDAGDADNALQFAIFDELRYC